MDIANVVVSGLALIVSAVALVLSYLATLYQTLTPAKLEWQKPLVFSLDDERYEPDCKHRPAIAIALTIHDAGAQPGIVQDIAVRAIKQGDSTKEAFFQARKIGVNCKYVTVPNIEENASPTRAVVVEGHRTETVVVQFEQRSCTPWSRQLGKYDVEVYSADRMGAWAHSTSFEFALTEKDMDKKSVPVRVIPCQHWTDEALDSRDALMKQFARREGCPS